MNEGAWSVEELEQIKTAEQRQAWQQTHKVSAEGIRKLVSRIQQLLTADPREGLRLSEWTLSLAMELNDPYAMGIAFRANGAALTQVDERSASLFSFDEALKIFAALSSEIEVAKTLMARITAFTKLSRFDEALRDSQTVSDILERLGEDGVLARHLGNVAIIHFRRDEFRQNLAVLVRAEEIMKRVNDQTALCQLYINRAVVLTSLNEAAGALHFYELGRKMAVDLAMPALVTLCDYNVCYLFFLQGKYSKALESLRAVRSRIMESGDRFRTALCDRDQSEIYLQLNMYDDALGLANRAYEALEPLGLSYDMAKALVLMGIAEHHLLNAARAEQLFQRARAIYERDNNRAWLSRIDCYRAIVLCETGRCSEGLRLAGGADAVFTEAGLKTNAAYSRLLTASFHLRLGNLDDSWLAARAALSLKDERCSPWVVHQLHYLVGAIHAERGNIEGAKASFRTAIAELESQRANIYADEQRMMFLKDKIPTYDALIRINLDAGDPESSRESFELVERAKSRTLVDLLAKAGHPIDAVGEAGPDVVERLNTIRDELNWYDRRLHEEEQPCALPGALVDEVRTREAELLRLQRELPVDPVGYLALQRVMTSSLEEVQHSVPAGTALIEYYVVDRQVVAFVITRNSFATYRGMADYAAVRRTFELLRFQLSRFTPGRVYVDRFHSEAVGATTRHLQQLYDHLIAPLQETLRGLGSIIFVPHDIMHYIPFHALHDGRQYLTDLFEVSYASSATVYRACTTRGSAAIRSQASPLVLGVTDPDNPGLSREANVVGSILNARVYLDADATVRRLREEGHDAPMIHIATHGRFRSDNPMFSAIKLGDGWLSLFDVFGLKTSAALVTLSGCGTGMNSVIAGDELLGLTRGFLYAGAGCLLVSLWDVDDTTTAELMNAIYGNIAEGQRLSCALRSAMLLLKEKHGHPYYWAPFVLIGNSCVSKESF